EALLERCDGRVADAGVDVAVLLQREEVRGVVRVLEHERRGLVDRHRPGPRRRVGDAPGVQGPGAEPEGVLGHRAALFRSTGAEAIMPTCAAGAVPRAR